ncbi:hypothetical protein pipiens_001459 [Culex pipiens pipiens]|uniref:HTH CENPB-type domain-containing protein n=1 Tax=Culex pipiens pipiens TaxID=38569 RepID=A0ABD1CRL0_CULPP
MGKVDKSKRYSEHDITQCLSEIKNRVPMKTACRKYNIPRSTIKFRLSSVWSGKTTKGPHTVLTAAEETEIVNWISRMARKGFPLTKERLVTTVQTFLAANPRPKQMKAGYKWYRGFLRRHPEISVRKPEKVSSAAATVEPEDIRRWHRMVGANLEEEGYAEILKDPSRLFNGDEFGLVLDPETKAVLVPKKTKNAYQIDTGSKKSITVLNSYSATGQAVPPCVILPYKRIPAEVTKSFPADWGVGKTEKCTKLGIILVCLYANCTHIIQPADVAIYRGLKAGWTKQVRIWQARNPGKTVRLQDFGGLLAKAIDCSFKPEFAINGFRACGLYPFDETAIDFSKCIAGKKNKPKSGGSVTCPPPVSDTVPVPRDLLKEFVDKINPSQAALYRAVEPDFFDEDAEKIVCSLYKNVLQSLDHREFQDMNDEADSDDDEEDVIADRADDYFMKEDFGEIAKEDNASYGDDSEAKSEADGDAPGNGRDYGLGDDADVAACNGFDDDSGDGSGDGPGDGPGDGLGVDADVAAYNDFGDCSGDGLGAGLGDDADVAACNEPGVDFGDGPGDKAGEADGGAQHHEVNEQHTRPDAYLQDHQQELYDPSESENIENMDQAQDQSILSFLSEPSTPKKKTNRKYKKPKSPPVLTSRKRVELHRKIAEEKAEKEQLKEQKRKDKAKLAEEKKLQLIDKASKRLERLKNELKEINS